MSVSKTYTADPDNVASVLTLYCSEEKPTTTEVARRLRTSPGNVRWILARHLPPDKYSAEKALRYSRSKMGPHNPMSGRSGALHPNWQGEVGDGSGYLQTKVNGRYVFIHRLVWARALGLEELPDWVDVHHIDGNKHNNDINNLALVTRSAHGQMHAKTSRFERSPLWDQWVHGTSRSPETTPTPLTGS